MKLYDHDPFVRVAFEPEDVERFRSGWPCFTGPESVSFVFQRSNGDLVDIEPSDFDGPEALAMADDAWSSYVEHRAPDVGIGPPLDAAAAAAEESAARRVRVREVTDTSNRHRLRQGAEEPVF